MEHFDLSGQWKFRRSPSNAGETQRIGLDDWMPASVPGTVHTDLMANGKIPDPFMGMNEKEVQWVEHERWIYTREFQLPESFAGAHSVDLVAEGLDTYADIKINGVRVGRTENMFIEHRLSVAKLLRPGANIIEVTFDSAVHRSLVLEKKHGSLRVALEPHRVYVRKAQYSFGWDWGPKFTTCGIWRPIRLEMTGHAVLRYPCVRVKSVNSMTARLSASVDIEGNPRAGFSMEVIIEGHGARVHRTIPVRGVTAHLNIDLPNPKLWWPNGLGDQPMYSATYNLKKEGAVIHSVTTSFGVRTAQLVQQKDKEGKSFVLHINGTPVFCKGADWIPSDTFLPRITGGVYERLLTLAKDAHMNMIRVWGGGIYEEEKFYETCDRLGLMVWQDFMFACGEYPEDPWFLRQVKEEATAVVRRLRNHPSVVVWCGNNECEWLFCTENPDKTADDMNGAVIFRKLLRDVVQALDGTRPYWRSSPYGDGFPNDESNGNHHQWNVWSFWKDYTEYEKDRARFITEFGFQAPANAETLAAVIPPEERRPQSPTMEHHNKQVEGTERLFRFQSAHLGVATDFGEFIYRGQLIQAYALKTAVEHWRRRMFRTAGALFWQLNDCWPVSSWSVIDSALQPKAGYYYAKRFFAPVLVSCSRSEKELSVWVTNDRLQRIRGEIKLEVRTVEGPMVWSTEKHVETAGNCSKEVLKVPLSTWDSFDSRTSYVRAELKLEGEAPLVNRFFRSELKHVSLPEPQLTFDAVQIEKGKLDIVIRARRFAKDVRLELEGASIEDNYVDVDAGGVVHVTVRTTHSPREAMQKLKLHWLKK